MAQVLNAPTKTVTVRSFYMDDTEITNSEYRQFVEWVQRFYRKNQIGYFGR